MTKMKCLICINDKGESEDFESETGLLWHLSGGTASEGHEIIEPAHSQSSLQICIVALQKNLEEVPITQYAPWQEIVLPANTIEDTGIRKYVVWEETHQSDTLEALEISEKDFIVVTKTDDRLDQLNQIEIHHYHEGSNLYTVNLTEFCTIY